VATPAAAVRQHHTCVQMEPRLGNTMHACRWRHVSATPCMRADGGTPGRAEGCECCGRAVAGGGAGGAASGGEHGHAGSYTLRTAASGLLIFHIPQTSEHISASVGKAVIGAADLCHHPD
jgi:hypothetical protein